MAYELHRVNMDYSKPLKEMISPDHYGFVNPDIYRIPIKRRQNNELEIYLIQFPVQLTHPKGLTSRQVRRQLKNMRLRPVELIELLALEFQHSELLSSRFIVGLGSGQRIGGLLLRCPVIRTRVCGGIVERAISLFPAGSIFAEPWSGNEWFAAVHK